MWRWPGCLMIPCYQASFLLTGSLISLHIYALHRNSAVWPDPEVLHLWAWRSDRVWAVGLPSARIWWVLKKALSISLGLWSTALFSWEYNRTASLCLHAFFCRAQVGRETTFPGPHNWGGKVKAVSVGDIILECSVTRGPICYLFLFLGNGWDRCFYSVRDCKPELPMWSYPAGPFTMLLRFVFLKPTSTNQPVIMCPKLVIVFLWAFKNTRPCHSG